MSDEHGRFTWVDLASHDMKAAVAWYGELFGWELGSVDESGPGPYGMFVEGGVQVGGIGELTEEMKQAMPPVWNSYVAVRDCAETVARARALGAEVVFDTQEVGDGVGKLAFLKDPAGAVFALWEGARPGESARADIPGRFCWQELATPDLDGAKSFYSELFGWKMERMEGPAPTPTLMIRAGDCEIAHALEMNEKWEGIPPHWSVYFRVEDTDATCAKAESTGGTVRVPPMDIPPGRFAVLADPQGATFYVIQPPT